MAWVSCQGVVMLPDTASITGPVHGSSTPRDIAVIAARTRRCMAVMIKNHTGAVAYTRQLRTAYLQVWRPSVLCMCAFISLVAVLVEAIVVLT